MGSGATGDFDSQLSETATNSTIVVNRSLQPDPQFMEERCSSCKQHFGCQPHNKQSILTSLRADKRGKPPLANN